MTVLCFLALLELDWRPLDCSMEPLRSAPEAREEEEVDPHRVDLCRWLPGGEGKRLRGWLRPRGPELARDWDQQEYRPSRVCVISRSLQAAKAARDTATQGLSCLDPHPRGERIVSGI